MQYPVSEGTIMDNLSTSSKNHQFESAIHVHAFQGVMKNRRLQSSNPQAWELSKILTHDQRYTLEE